MARRASPETGQVLQPTSGDAVTAYISRGRVSSSIAWIAPMPSNTTRRSQSASSPSTGRIRRCRLSGTPAGVAVDRVGALNAVVSIISESGEHHADEGEHAPNRTGLARPLDRVRSTDHLCSLMRRIETLSDVLEVRRWSPATAGSRHTQYFTPPRSREGIAFIALCRCGVLAEKERLHRRRCSLRLQSHRRAAQRFSCQFSYFCRPGHARRAPRRSALVLVAGSLRMLSAKDPHMVRVRNKGSSRTRPT